MKKVLQMELPPLEIEGRTATLQDVVDVLYPHMWATEKIALLRKGSRSGLDRQHAFREAIAQLRIAATGER